MVRTLAAKIATYIIKEGEATYSALLTRAQSKGIDETLFQEAMTYIHRKEKRIAATSTTDGEIIYKVSIPKGTPTWALAQPPYPIMDETNNCKHEVFEGIDLGWMFMKPEDARDYWWKKKKAPWLLKK